MEQTVNKENDYFIAVYTNSVKDYCDEQFFQRILGLKGKNYLGIVDNSKGDKYMKRLRTLAPTAAIRHLDIDHNPRNSLFQRNVCESVNVLREDFLRLNKDYFLIIESDVLPPVDLLPMLDKSIKYLDQLIPSIIVEGENRDYQGPWGSIGARYYEGFHDYELKGIHRTDHTLSGCTVYKRELIEKYPFRYNPESLAQFPDYWICHDSGYEYSLWNDHDIQCEHLHTKHGSRMSKSL